MNMLKNTDYYIGLDMGTSSLGWAVTDESYNILKFNSKAMWGVRLFSEAKTAADARGFRTGRRRLARQKWRVKMLQELFSEEIAKVDPGFFMRLRESRLHVADKNQANKQRFNLFADSKYTDIDYHKDYPTIYHLRNALIARSDSFDIRLVYIALQHIIKKRGHFLFEGISAENVTDFKSIFAKLQGYIQEELGLSEWECANVEVLENVLKDKNKSVKAKQFVLKGIIPNSTKAEKSIMAFLTGAKGKLSDLFTDEELLECDKNSFSFKTDNYEEAVLPIIEPFLNDRIEGIELFKAIYDWSLLVGILKGKKYLSEAKIEDYEQHASDLSLLKSMLKGTGLYNAVFRKEVADNYFGYKEGNGTSQEDFCKFVKAKLDSIPAFKNRFKVLNNIEDAITKEDELLFKIANGIAFPKQTSKANGVIPVQIHKVELDAILDKAEKYLPFMLNTDENGLTVKEKIKQIMLFKIPYYVGPLAGTRMSKEKGRCWCVRNSGKIYPWNMEEIIDFKASAEKFITNMTAKCSYLIGEDVLPKNSLTYCEFMARNEINSITVDGQRLPVEVLNDIYDNLLVLPEGSSKVTKKKILDYLKRNNYPGKEIAGIDNEIKTQLKSYKDFRRIFGKEYVAMHKDEIENIIRWITLFADEKQMLRRKIEDAYPNITKDQLKNICRLKYKDWGTLSNTLLDSSSISFTDTSTGEVVTILGAMRAAGKNFMELLGNSSEYSFKGIIEEFNAGIENKSGHTTYKDVEELYVSPKVKRSIWQTLKTIEEIKKVTGHAPKRIFIEMAREEGEKERTKSRLDRLKELYAACGEDVKELQLELDNYSEDELRRDQLYLYFTQMGRCMYTGQPIDINELANTNVYDIDHILPQSKTKDDSLNNRVLVLRKVNTDKTDIYPLDESIRTKMHAFWKMLAGKELISKSKYERLVRNTPLTEEELAGFINRQLVETRQSTKAVAEILKKDCPDTEIVYVKAGNVSDFRHEFGFVKFRDINDLHHAKDAYLNIVVGNTYHTRFTKDPLNFIRKLRKGDKYTLNTKQIYAREIKAGNYIAWLPGDEGSMATVKKVMHKNNILFTRMQIEGKGELYKATLQKAGKGQLPLKKGMSIDEYGGYNSLATAYFTLVESEGKKGKKLRTIETVPLIYAKKSQEELTEYFAESCGLENPKILVPKIKQFTKFELDGYPLHISGRTGSQLIAYSAVQCVLEENWVEYLKRALKYRNSIIANCEKLGSTVENDRLQAKRNLVYFEKHLGLSKENNIVLFDLLLDKQTKTIYSKRPASQAATLSSKRRMFIEYDLGKQIELLGQIIKLLESGSQSADFTLIGKGKSCGIVKFSNNITDRNSFIIINQSITGLFEQSIDLLKL